MPLVNTVLGPIEAEALDDAGVEHLLERADLPRRRPIRTHASRFRAARPRGGAVLGQAL